MDHIWSVRAHAGPPRSFHFHSEDTRCATGVRRRGRPRCPISEISCHSNAEPACAIRCTGQPPRSGSCNTSDRRLPASESRVPRAAGLLRCSRGGAEGRAVAFGTLFWTRCCRPELRFYFNAAVCGAMFRPCDDAARAQAHRHEPGRPLQLSPAPRPHPRSPAYMAGDRRCSSPWR